MGIFRSSYIALQTDKPIVQSFYCVVTIVVTAIAFLLVPASSFASPISLSQDVQQHSSSHSNGVLFIGTSTFTPSDLRAERYGLKEDLAGYTFAALTARTFSPNIRFSDGWLHLRTSGDVDDPARRLTPEGALTSVGFSLVNHRGEHLEPTYLVHGTVESDFSLVSSSPLIPQSVRIKDFTQRTEDMDLLSKGLFSSDAWALGEGAAAAVADSSGNVKNWLPMPTLPLRNAEAAQEYRQNMAHILDSAPSDVVVDLSVPSSASYPLSERVVREQKVAFSLSQLLQANAASAEPRPVIIASLSNLPNERAIQLFATNLPDLSITPSSTSTKEAAPASISDASSTSTASSLDSPAGVLLSSTTKAEGLITINDVRYILASIHGMSDESSAIGSAALDIFQEPTLDAALKRAADIELHSAVALRSNSAWYSFFTSLGLIGIAGFFLALFLTPWLKQKPRIWRIVTIWNHLAYAFMPAALILNFIPWWKLPWLSHTSLTSRTAIALTALIALALVFLTRLTQHPIAVTSLIALLVLAVDIMGGSAHQRNGFMGSLILSSRRYYGISNRTYLILIIAGLLALVPIMSRYYGKRTAGIAVAVTGLGVLLVDAVPSWGADFGGPPGIIAAFGIAAVLVARMKFRWWFVFVWIVLSGGSMALIGLASARSSSTSHIGNFWQSFGSAQSFALIGGKIRDVLRSFTAYPRTLITILLIVLLVVAGLIILAKLARQHPVYAQMWTVAAGEKYVRIAALGIALGILIAVPINDSGMLMIKESIYIAAPALAALASQSQLS